MNIKYIESSDTRARKFNELIKKEYPQIINTKKPNIIMVAGGDGAMMHAIREYNHLGIPFFGVAKGTLNFLMNETEDEKKLIQDLVDNKINLHFQKAQTIKITYNSKKLGYAINDIILGTSIIGYHSFTINSEDETLSNLEVKGSGLCISTDLGSTAYSYNLGNPAIPLDNNLIIISGIVCNKYINDILKIQNIKIGINSDREKCDILIDGIKQEHSFKRGDTIILEKGKTIEIGLISLKDFTDKRKCISNRHRNF